MNTDALFEILAADLTAMQHLRAVRDFGPKQAFLAAGFVRNRYWDSLYSSVQVGAPSDVDVVYFDTGTASKSMDLHYECILAKRFPDVDWQVRNQAYMHGFGGHMPFTDLEDALMHWSETATALGVRLDEHDHLHLIAPFGLDDLYGHVLRMTPVMQATDPTGFSERIERKQWRARWPQVTVISGSRV